LAAGAHLALTLRGRHLRGERGDVERLHALFVAANVLVALRRAAIRPPPRQSPTQPQGPCTPCVVWQRCRRCGLLTGRGPRAKHARTCCSYSLSSGTEEGPIVPTASCSFTVRAGFAGATGAKGGSSPFSTFGSTSTFASTFAFFVGAAPTVAPAARVSAPAPPPRRQQALAATGGQQICRLGQPPTEGRSGTARWPGTRNLPKSRGGSISAPSLAANPLHRPQARPPSTGVT
jgi:hypothetical protein